MTQPTGNAVLDSILWAGSKWSGGSGGTVKLKYSFDSSEFEWYEDEKDAYKGALNEISMVADIEFQQTFARTQANLIAYNVSNYYFGDGTFAAHETPKGARKNAFGVEQAEGWFNHETWSFPSHGVGYSPDGLAQGGFGFQTLLHELAHGLGLAHPHDKGGGSNKMPGVGGVGDYGPNKLNQGVFTVMSYNDGWDAVQNPYGNDVSKFGYANTLAALDIAAIQYLYGANENHKGGNSTYKITDKDGWTCIWDTGGTDTIDYDGSGNVVIDLRSATLDNTPSGGGYLSYVKNSGSNKYYGGITIAGDFTGAISNKNGEIGVIIENADGSSGADTLRGNKVANTLLGQKGNDKLFGFAGNDVLKGSAGKDKLFGGGGGDKQFGGKGADQLKGGTGNDQLCGNYGADTLLGGRGKDILKGGSSGDRLDGGSGADVLWGGPGADKIVYRKGYGTDRVKDFANNKDTLLLDDALWGGGLTKQQVLNQHAKVSGGDTIFAFGSAKLIVEDVGNKNVLLDDITFI